MITSILIIVFSAALFAYWFRYTCLLILDAKSTKDFTEDVAVANQLSILEVQQQLAAEPSPASLDALRSAIDRDYQVLSYLLQHSGGIEKAGSSLEQAMLRLDFRMMSVWYGISSRFAASSARRALREMSDIVGHFANAMGERQSSSLA